MGIDPKATLLRLIGEAEQRYGQREAFELTTVTVEEGRKWAQTLVNSANRTIEVRVSVFVNDRDPQTIYQLAHEAVHCLFPVQRLDTIYIEEGLAIRHALDAAKNLDRNYPAKCLVALRACP